MRVNQLPEIGERSPTVIDILRFVTLRMVENTQNQFVWRPRGGNAPRRPDLVFPENFETTREWSETRKSPEKKLNRRNCEWQSAGLYPGQNWHRDGRAWQMMSDWSPMKPSPVYEPVGEVQKDIILRTSGSELHLHDLPTHSAGRLEQQWNWNRHQRIPLHRW